MKKKRILAMILAAAMTAGLLAGCGSGGDGDQGDGSSPDALTIKFGVVETANVTSDIWDNMISSFEEAHPEIKVEKVVAGSDDRPSFWRTMLNSGEFPDVVVEADTLSTMNIFAEVPADVQDIFNEDLLSEFGGKVISVPATVQYKGQCYYNKAVFEELNLTEPTTWDEFLDVCQKIKDAGKVPLMCGGTGDTWATGGMYWIAQGDTQIQAAYPDFPQGMEEGTYKWNNEVTQKVLTQFQDMVDKGYYYEGGLSLSYSQCAEAFLNGDAAMLIDGSWMNATLDNAGNEDFGVFAVPAMDGSQIAIGNAATWAVYEDSKNQDAAWEFIKYVFSENTEPYADFLACDGLFSTTKEPVTYEMGPVATDYLENIAGWEVRPEVNKIAGDYVMPSGMQTFMEKSFQNIFNGADVSAELDTWDTEYQRLMDAQ